MMMVLIILNVLNHVLCHDDRADAVHILQGEGMLHGRAEERQGRPRP